jgi:hypothetical protein
VLSIGGNDVYLGADVQTKLVKSLLPFHAHLREEVAASFRRRYATVLDAVAAAAPQARILPVGA